MWYILKILQKFREGKIFRDFQCLEKILHDRKELSWRNALYVKRQKRNYNPNKGIHLGDCKLQRNGSKGFDLKS